MNIAKGGKATQSSTWRGRYTADLAVDGNTGKRFFFDTCTHTACYDRSPYWMVCLEKTFTIDSLTIHNPDKSCKFRKWCAAVGEGVVVYGLCGKWDNTTDVDYWHNIIICKASAKFYSEMFVRCSMSGPWSMNIDIPTLVTSSIYT